MKKLFAAALMLFSVGAFAAEEEKAPAPAYPVSVVVDDATVAYNLAVISDADDVKGAKSYIDS